MAQKHDPLARTDDQHRRLTEERRRLEGAAGEADPSDEPNPDDPGGQETGEPSEGELRDARRRLEQHDGG